MDNLCSIQSYEKLDTFIQDVTEELLYSKSKWYDKSYVNYIVNTYEKCIYAKYIVKNAQYVQ